MRILCAMLLFVLASCSATESMTSAGSAPTAQSIVDRFATSTHDELTI
jgi:hypothetical protein